MIQLSKVLCPTDFSEASDKAVRYAVGLAKRVNAQLRFLHIEEESFLRNAEPAESDVSSMPAHYIKMLLDEKKTGLHVDVKIVRGTPVDMILRQADEWFADLVVIGSHGRSGLKRLMMGSVAEAVFRAASIPVLIVKQDTTDRSRA